MELLARYLQAVKKYLPLRRQDDIIAELRANMESQLEDKESELGRPLTLGEQEDWLRQFGHPIMVAARYQPQQYLIGPAIFPVYWYVLRMAFLWATVIYTIVSTVLIVFNTPSGSSVLAAMLRIPGVLLSVAAWVTVVFVAFEFISTHFPDKVPSLASLSAKWHPSSLPPLEKPSATGKRPRSYNQAVAEVVFGFLFLAWLVLVPQNPYLVVRPRRRVHSKRAFQTGAGVDGILLVDSSAQRCAVAMALHHPLARNMAAIPSPAGYRR